MRDCTCIIKQYIDFEINIYRVINILACGWGRGV
jgi:hypothetical protein